MSEHLISHNYRHDSVLSGVRKRQQHIAVRCYGSDWPRLFSADFTRVDRWGHCLGAPGMSAVAGEFGETARVMTIGTTVFFALRCRTVASGMGTFIAHESFSFY